jgi:phage gp36-like protein
LKVFSRQLLNFQLQTFPCQLFFRTFDMPIFATRDDLNKFFSSANITDWADKDRDGSLSDAELASIDAALEAAEAVVDSYLVRAGFASIAESTTFAELPSRTQVLLKQWTIVIAGYHIHAWRGLRDKINPLQTLYDQTISHLKSLQTGQTITGLSKDANVRFGTGSDPRQPTDELNNLRSDAWDW